MLKFPKGHGFRLHFSSSKSGAQALAKKIGGAYRIVKLKKPKRF